MLGDGHLSIAANNINAKLMVGRAVKDEEYLRYEMSIFDNFLPPAHQNGQIYYNRSVDKRTGAARAGCSFVTVASPSLTAYHTLWYKPIEGTYKKVVPSVVELNAQIIAHWLADDGSIDYNKLPYRLRTEISTHGFSQEEVQYLASLLNERYQENFLVRPKHRKGKTYYIIKVYDSGCRAMFADIDVFFKMGRKRIWDKPESRFYTDQPKRQTNIGQLASKRKAIIDKIIRDRLPITMKVLARELGLEYNGKTDYKMLNKFLQPYLDDGSIVKDTDPYNNNVITIRTRI
jgi:hypothetical protein